MDIPDDTRQQIENGLRDWHNPESAARKRYEAAKEKWDKAMQPLQDAIAASERLTGDDFAIRINPC